MNAGPFRGAGYSLRQAMLVGILLPLAVLSALLVLAIAQWTEQALEGRLQGEIELIARAVAPPISSHLQDSDVENIRGNLESLFSIRRVYGAAVYDQQGELVLAVGTADTNLRHSRAASGVVASGEDEGTYREVGGENVYAYFTPLLDAGGRIQGLLQITRDRREMDEAMRRVNLTAWIVWGIAVLLCVILTRHLYRRLVGERVEELLARFHAFALGDRETHIPTSRSPREFANIASSFNAMVDATRETEQDLERTRAEEQSLAVKLEESERAAIVGRVAQGLAHELGAPLTVINGRVRQLARRVEGEQVAGIMDAIREQASRMGDIVRQLLTYGHHEPGEHTAIRLRYLVESVCAVSDAEAGGITVSVDCAEATIHGDPLRVELAVSNLLRNALRHARSEVRVAVRTDAAAAVVSVDDDGPGVAETDLGQVFEPFFTREPTGQGTGLGLAIVQRVMEEHNGSAHCSQAAGSGARFELRFPRAESGSGT